MEAVKFVEKFLRLDGVFLLRLLEETTNGITAMEVTSALWDMFIPNQKEARTNGIAKSMFLLKPSAVAAVADDTGTSRSPRTPTAPHPKEFEANHDL